MMRRGILGGVLVWAAVLPAHAASDITLSGNAALLTQYVDRGLTNSAERPAVQAEFDLYYKEIYYAGIWGSNVDFGLGPNGQDLANLELDFYVGVAPTVGKWSFDIAAYYVAYPSAFDPDGEFNYVEIWTGVSRSFFNDKLKLTLCGQARHRRPRPSADTRAAPHRDFADRSLSRKSRWPVRACRLPHRPSRHNRDTIRSGSD